MHRYMLELFKTYTVGDIIIFIIILALGIKQAVELIDWIKGKINKGTSKAITEKERIEKIDKKLENYDKILDNITENIKELKDETQLLISSDKDAIKAFITEKHHYFCYTQKWIDDYSLDVLERRYEHYVDEKGNSFIKDLMEELRELPRVPQ